jgi:hypothetical protein
MDPCPATACYSRPLTAHLIRKIEKTTHLASRIRIYQRDIDVGV